MSLTSVKPDLTSLVRAAQAGDEAAYGTLVEANWVELVRFARSVVGDSDAEDVVQEGLVCGWRDLPSLRSPERLRSWLFSVVFRRCLRWKRWQRIWLSLGSVPDAGVCFDPDTGIDVATWLRRLTAAQRAVLHLTVVEGMTDAEVGDSLGIAPGTVRAQRRRARERVARMAKGYHHA